MLKGSINPLDPSAVSGSLKIPTLQEQTHVSDVAG